MLGEEPPSVPNTSNICSGQKSSDTILTRKRKNFLQDKQAYIGSDFSPNTKNETRAPNNERHK